MGSLQYFRTAPKSFNAFVSSLITTPFLLLLFLNFATVSTELLHIKILIFKIKLNNILVFISVIIFFLVFRKIRIKKYQFFAFVLILLSLIISALNSTNLFACSGFIAFFIFNYIFYFLSTTNLFYTFDANYVLRLYFTSYYWVGIYAACQVFFSIFEINLPGAQQGLYCILRGQAFCYEPSYLALYLTSFTMFETSRFILQKKLDRNLSKLIWPTFFLLITTSTGCLFSYFALLTIFAILSCFKFIKQFNFSMKKLLLKFTSTFLILFSILFALNRNLIEKGFLKFFYSGTQHFSFFIRWKGIIYFWNAFLDNLFIGVGLGGASTYMMKSLFGETVDPLDPLILDMVPATNVTMETLASLGLLGGIAFVYLFCTIIKSFKDALKIEYITEEEKLNLISFAISLCVVIFTLQFNQSIMRPYIWLHTGICVGYANYIKDKYTNFIGVPSL